MKVLKKIGIGIGVLFLLLLIIGFLLPSEMNVKRTVKIEAPIDQVYNQINDLRNWEKWSPWKKMDPLMELSYSNPPMGKGAFYKWKSDNPNVGNGKLTIAEAYPNKNLAISLDFEEWGESVTEFEFTQKGKKVELTWSMENDMGNNPFAKYGGLFMKGTMKKQFDEGLRGIKEIAEDRN